MNGMNRISEIVGKFSWSRLTSPDYITKTRRLYLTNHLRMFVLFLPSVARYNGLRGKQCTAASVFYQLACGMQFPVTVLLKKEGDGMLIRAYGGLLGCSGMNRLSCKYKNSNISI